MPIRVSLSRWVVSALPILVVFAGVPGNVCAQAPRFAGQWGEIGTGPGQFAQPTGIAVDTAGFVYVTDYLTHRVQKFTSTGNFVTSWGSPGTPGALNLPWGIAVDPAGTVYVGDYGDLRVYRFTNDGQYLGSLNASVTPLGIAVGPSGVYVCDSTGDRVLKFDPSGSLVGSFGSSGNAPGQFVEPSGIAVDAHDNIYVTDEGLHRVTVYSSSGVLVRTWGREGQSPGELYRPYGAAITAQGTLQVACFDSRIEEFRLNGTFVQQWGGLGADDGQFGNILEIAVGPENTIYVVDAGNLRIQYFSLSVSVAPTSWGTLKQVYRGQVSR